MKGEYKMKSSKYTIFLALLACVVATVSFTAEAQAQAKKPNIVVIWGDDIGESNISALSFGLMGYQTLTSTGSPRKA